MLSYRKRFHAGNHSDVFTHTVHSLIIESLKEKEKPFLHLDTHAGAGRYQLVSEHSDLTGEYQDALAPIVPQDSPPADPDQHIGVVHHSTPCVPVPLSP
ncbi:23S rRNA (adenine(2030)-N(6))-methyltransferase RlmJ, partial [Salmonella enterica]|uniref:23S rRNA (adenine(2030)-N(6))-methyltransferase RlmJ n=1 Tax=Salmonella enterica TaxID=28901 RepID=UPI00398C78F5